MPIAAFLVGILLGAMGLDLGLFPEGGMFLARSLASSDTFIVDAISVVNNPGDPGAWIGALFDIGWWFFWNILVNLISWWLVGAVMGDVALHFTPPGLAVTLLGLGIGAVLGWTDLVTQGCSP